jgi:hypothetical protein
MDILMANLSQFINQHIKWHPSRAQCLLLIVMGMIQSRSVQMQRIAAHFDDDVSLESRVQRIYRFFADQEFDYAHIALIILSCLGLLGKPLDLILDRTNWKFGIKDINYLVLAVQIPGLGAIPLLWVDLDKAGNSNTAERIDLLRKMFEICPDLQIRSLTGDREFIGEEWTDYLIKEGVSFFIRVKENMLVELGDKDVHVRDFFSHVTYKGKPRKLHLKLDDYDLFLVGTRSKDGNLVIVLTNRDMKARDVLAVYKTRWNIECLFKNLKRSGFNLEDTHITIPERLKKLMAVCALAAAFCIKAGIIKNRQRPIPYKKTVHCNLYSFFQYGLNYIRTYFNKIMKWITDPWIANPLKKTFSFKDLGIGVFLEHQK